MMKVILLFAKMVAALLVLGEQMVKEMLKVTEIDFARSSTSAVGRFLKPNRSEALHKRANARKPC